MAQRDQIVKYCEEYLKVSDFQDYCTNGLQVEGKKDVKKVITGVSLSLRLIQAAIEKKADMLLVHHGIFLKMLDPTHQIKGVMKKRLKMLLENDINLLGFHLPLDAHPVIGNNISLCRLFGVKKAKVVDKIGYYGELARSVDLNSIVESINDKLGTRSYVISAGPRMIKRLAFISGGAASHYPEIAKKKVDLFVAGEISEGQVREIEECGMNFIAAGHYNTEKLGIQNLGNLLAKKFRIKAEFVDIPNEI